MPGKKNNDNVVLRLLGRYFKYIAYPEIFFKFFFYKETYL